MHWEDERYVRLYTRDTATWIMAPWQARAILPLILRKLDRAGVMELGEDGLEALAALIVMPLEVVEAGMPYWLRKGTFELNDDKLVMPNYIDAQEAKASDKQRAREYRERNRDRARSSAVGDDELQHTSNSITERDSTSHDVTDGNTPSHGVTPSLAVPSRTVPNQENTIAAEAAGESKPKRKGRPSTTPGYQELIDLYFQLYRELKGVDPVMGTRTGKAAKDILKAMPLSDAMATVRLAFARKWFRDNSCELHHIAGNMNMYRPTHEAEEPVTDYVSDLPELSEQDNIVSDPDEVAKHMAEIRRNLNLEAK